MLLDQELLCVGQRLMHLAHPSFVLLKELGYACAAVWLSIFSLLQQCLWKAGGFTAS